MNAIQLTAVDFRLSPKVRQHVAEKFGALDHYLSDVQRCSITIHPLPAHGFRIDALLHRSRGPGLALHALGESVYAALNHAASTARGRCRRVHRRLGGRAGS